MQVLRLLRDFVTWVWKRVGGQPEAGGGGGMVKSYLHFHQLASLPTPFRKGDGCNGCNSIIHWGDGVLVRGSRAAIAGEGGWGALRIKEGVYRRFLMWGHLSLGMEDCFMFWLFIWPSINHILLTVFIWFGASKHYCVDRWAAKFAALRISGHHVQRGGEKIKQNWPGFFIVGKKIQE